MSCEFLKKYVAMRFELESGTEMFNATAAKRVEVFDENEEVQEMLLSFLNERYGHYPRIDLVENVVRGSKGLMHFIEHEGDEKVKVYYEIKSKLCPCCEKRLRDENH